MLAMSFYNSNIQEIVRSAYKETAYLFYQQCA